MHLSGGIQLQARRGDRDRRDRRSGGPAGRYATGARCARSRPAVQPPAWEKPLRALIDGAAPQAAGNPLAIELALHADGFPGRGARRLMAHLMRPGARGGWVIGSPMWSGLGSWHVQSGDYRADHLALIRELYAVHRAREVSVGCHYHYGGERTLDLSGCDSPQLWSLLDEGSRLGLKLVDARPELGEVRGHQQGELLIDVTREGEQVSLVSAARRRRRRGRARARAAAVLRLQRIGRRVRPWVAASSVVTAPSWSNTRRISIRRACRSCTASRLGRHRPVRRWRRECVERRLPVRNP